MAISHSTAVIVTICHSTAVIVTKYKVIQITTLDPFKKFKFDSSFINQFFIYSMIIC